MQQNCDSVAAVTTKIVLIYCFSDREKLSKFEAESQEFVNYLTSLEKYIQTMKGQNNF